MLYRFCMYLNQNISVVQNVDVSLLIARHETWICKFKDKAPKWEWLSQDIVCLNDCTTGPVGSVAWSWKAAHTRQFLVWQAAIHTFQPKIVVIKWNSINLVLYITECGTNTNTFFFQWQHSCAILVYNVAVKVWWPHFIYRIYIIHSLLFAWEMNQSTVSINLEQFYRDLREEQYDEFQVMQVLWLIATKLEEIHDQNPPKCHGNLSPADVIIEFSEDSIQVQLETTPISPKVEPLHPYTFNS